jgi:hypothetical protein
MSRTETHVVNSLKQAHQALQDDLRKLEAAARSTSANAGEELRACVSATRAVVKGHFQLEEQGGYMDAVRKRQPRFERVVHELGEEHRQLTQSVEELLGQTDQAAAASDAFRERVLAWVQRIRQHEAREIDIIQEAYNLDIAAED